MKKILFFLGLCFMGATAIAATFTVSNNTNLPGSPGQYSTIAAAVAASNSGDTIMIQGSPTAYSEGINVNWTLTIIGPGYNPQNPNGYNAVINGYINFGNSSSNSQLIGIYTTYTIGWNNSVPVSNYTISRCYTSTINPNGSSVTNVTVKNCIVTGNINVGSNPVNILNNIFTTYNYVSGQNQVTVQHHIANNLFLCNAGIQYLQNAVIENNIFYSSNQTTNLYNCTFNNNYVYSLTAFALPTAAGNTNIGSGNLNDQTNIYKASNWDCTTGSTFNNTANFRPAANTVVHNAGTDGTDIGPTGGAYPIYNAPAPYPLTGEPALPKVKSIIMPATSVPAGGTLNITINATSGN